MLVCRIVLISGIESCGDSLNKKARDRGQQFIQERYPGSEVMLFDAFPDSQLEFLTDDCIRGRAIEVMSKLESSSKVYATQLCLPDAMG